MSFDPFTAPLLPLPAQPDDVAWPNDAWPTGPAPAAVDLDAFYDELFDEDGPMHTTFASVVIHRGRLVAQRYASAIEHFDREPEPVTESTPLLSWSMAKSMLHAVVGPLVADGRLVLDAPPRVPEWAAAADGRETITLQQLLEMRDGLDFIEDYVDDTRSDVINMLFGAGAPDVAHFAADRGLTAAPGTRFNYSSGTTNIIAATVGRVVGTGDAFIAHLRAALFDRIGMSSATARCDDAGTWIASSYVYATAQDFARFGYLYLRGGQWNGDAVLPTGWVDHARTVRSQDPDGDGYYGAQWWMPGDEFGTFNCAGYEGQYIWCVPALDLVIVRLGKTEAERRHHIADWRKRVIEAFAAAEE